jgi:hypothetical protein
MFVVTVNNSNAAQTGAGNYVQGASVSISAGSPVSGYRFSHWTANPSVTFENPNNPNTTFTMPNNGVTVTAHFVPMPATSDFVLSIGGQSSGIVGQRRTITVNANNNADIAGKYLLVQITRIGSPPSVMAIEIKNTGAQSESITISYQHANSIINVWLMSDLSNVNLASADISGTIIFAHATATP